MLALPFGEMPHLMIVQRLLRATDRFRWPEGKRIALVFNIAYEGWSAGKAPGIGPMGNPLQPGYFDTNAHSWGTFGAVRGIQRLLDIAQRHQIRASVMVNGVLAELYPETVRRIHNEGHEIVAHSYGMDVIPVYLKAEEERANISRTTELLERVTGAKAPGWISPRGTGSLMSPQLLAEAGYLWHGDCNDDDAPYILEFGDRSIVAIPLTMDVNDLPHAMRFGRTPRDFVTLFADTLEAMRTRESRSLMLDVTAHCHVYGRAAGAWAFAETMKLARACPDVWIATRLEMARHVMDHKAAFAAAK